MNNNNVAEQSVMVLIPCLNEEKTLSNVIKDIHRALENRKKYEICVIDDGSTDNSAEIAQKAGAVVIRHEQNRGVGQVLITGMDHFFQNDFDILVNIDADGQFDPADIPSLVKPITDGIADFVSASRFMDPSMVPKMPVMKLWGNRRMSQLISHLTGRKFHDVSCGFRAYSRDALLGLNLQGRFTYTQEMFIDLAFKGMRIREVPVHVKYFDDRRSRVASSLVRYAARSGKIIFRTYRDHRPLQFFWALASLFMIAGLAFGSILLNKYIHTGTMKGQIWSGFVGGSLFAIGLMFGVVGLLADMLDRLRNNQEKILTTLRRFYRDRK